MKLPSFASIFRRESRSSIENPQVPVSSRNFLQFFLGGWQKAVTGEVVTVARALAVPAVWCAVNFSSGTLAALPLHLHQRGKSGTKQVERGRSAMGRLATLLQDAPTEESTSFTWRKAMFQQVLTGGRAFTFIERDALGQVINLWLLDPANMQVSRVNGRLAYAYRDGSRTLNYRPSEIIDLAFMRADDGVGHLSPILMARDAIGMALAATNYSAKLFANGGVPPLALEGPITTPGGVKRAATDVENAIRDAAEENRAVLTLPTGHTLKPIGLEPDKQQLIELQRFSVEQIARVYSLPSLFLHDLTRATDNNGEQQGLHLVKHHLARFVEEAEQEMNLKLFGRGDVSHFVKFNLDGVLRGDFKARMEGIARGVQNAVLTPNEARALLDREPLAGGEELLIQGATVPLALAGQKSPSPPPPAA